MSKVEKLLDRIKVNPKHVHFDDLEKALKFKGYDIINVKGSHFSFSNGETTITVVKPHGSSKFCHVLDVKEVIRRCFQ